LSALSELGRRAEHHGVRLAIETGQDRGEELKSVLDAIESLGLAVSIDPSSLLQAGIDPVACVRESASWVVHAYAKDATGSAGASIPNPRGLGYPPGALDWEEYLGALEEIGYRGFLTVWPAAGKDPAAEFTAVADRVKQLS
jgi:sugar phosphate isomerase/epimerase